MKKSLFSWGELRALAFVLPSVVLLVVIILSARRSSAFDDFAERAFVTSQADTVEVVEAVEIVLFAFDPNTATYEEFRTLGLSASTAASVVKYRERGKRFEIPEDFATCYGITDSIYAALKPYITIGEEFRLKPFASSADASTSVTTTRRERLTPTEKAVAYLATHPVIDPNALTVEEWEEIGCSVRQAEAVVRWRDEREGFRSVAEVEECRYLPLEVFDVIAAALVVNLPAPLAEESSEPALIDINSVDSATLVTVRGIGARTASDIIAYRERLGGFANVEQLADLAVMTERNYEQIITQIFVDSCKISKIDINFARPESLESHPYMTPKRLRKILKNRQLKGGWSTIEDMILDNTLTVEEAERLSPYLHFSPVE
ncbi:MAG: helix-hairpin-helix domain-containing protein [Tidjanibacter sp.]|nr:helix-hairpin-helix domain-containing protein [Tidjanibacter sp.]